MARPGIRNLRMRTAVGLRKLEQKGLQSRSPSVRKQWKALRPVFNRTVSRLRPPRRFFPGEKFVSLEELGDFDSNGDARLAFQQIRKGKFWKNRYELPLATGFLAAAPALSGLVAIEQYFRLSPTTNKGFALLLGAGGAAAVAGVIAVHKTIQLGVKRVSGIQEGVGALKTFLERNSNPRLRQLVDSGKFNLVVADLENNGFRFAKILPKDQELMIRLGNQPNGGVVVFDKNGKL